MIDILPGILEHDLVNVKEKIARVANYVTWVHIDVCDRTYVDNETFRDFSQWKGFPEHLSFEAHLMVNNPERYIRPLVDAGFKRLIAHVESQDPRRFLQEAEYEEIEVGLALDGQSSVDELEPFIEELDVALIMGYQAGFSGQEFQQETLEKLKALHLTYPEVLLEVDGGVNDKTIQAIKDCGARRMVTTSYLFKQQDIAFTLQELAKEPASTIV